MDFFKVNEDLKSAPTVEMQKVEENMSKIFRKTCNIK